MLARLPVQIAYHVPNSELAAERFARDYGWGPFFLFEHIKLSSCTYRGRPAHFDHTSAYGQAGELMIELISQDDDAQSVLRERFARNESGIHHVASFVPDLEAALSEARTCGPAVALDACTATGTRFAMLDTVAELGHMLELYERKEGLLKFYQLVRRAAQDWDGSEPVRRLPQTRPLPPSA
ncbi:MAG TPA: VOC family protein [Steroidobacteraceae bacterium]|jgi:hypothetical protein